MSQPIPHVAVVPKSFGEYVRSFGPGLVVVLTWLGAGDIVSMAVAGSDYGYSLMWALVLAVVMRFLFVSLIAKYQLCNQHGESLLDGLARLHPWYPPLLLALAVIMGHAYASYMTVGIGEILKNVSGFGEIWQWALLGNGVALALIFQPAYGRVEVVFKVFLALLTVSFIGTALWVGPNMQGILQGLYRFELPEQAGKFNPLLVSVAMIGAVGGSLMNLVYPYFLEAKGWRGPQYRRVQIYDFLLAIIVLIVVNLAIWTLAAELLHPAGLRIKETSDLAKLLSRVLGSGGRLLFYLGVFAAVFTSLVGNALGLAYLGSHAYLRWRAGSAPLDVDYRQHPLYRAIVVWCLVSPLVWTIFGKPNFAAMTIFVNSGQVVLIPPILYGIWRITADERYIGAKHRNRWWENLVVVVLFVTAVYGVWKSVESVIEKLSGAQ